MNSLSRSGIFFLSVLGALVATQVSAQQLPSKTNALEVPTLTLPDQSDPLIGKTSAPPKNTDITRTEGTATAVNPNAPPRPSTPAPGTPPVQAEPGSQTTETSYAKGMIISGKARVFDGHSFVIGKYILRLNGVEAPGLDQLCSDSTGTSWRCGEAAFNAFKKIAEGRKLACVVDEPAGHGAAATCAAPGINDIGLFLAQSGFVVVNKFGTAEYRFAQDVALSHKAGIWVGPFDNPVEWRKRNR